MAGPMGGGGSGPLLAAIEAGHDLRARALLADAGADRAQTLDDLARCAAAGGPSAPLAIELLLEQLEGSGVVRRFAAAALVDRAAIDDVVQDSLISIAESIGSYRGTARVTSWVHRIVRNRVVDHLRRQRASAPLPAEDVAPSARMSSTIALRATLQEVLQDLPDRYREPVVLRDVQSLPYAQIAERLDRSEGTVKSQVARGRAMLAARLQSVPTAEGVDD